jgi:ribose transport system substrate-binding protein
MKRGIVLLLLLMLSAIVAACGGNKESAPLVTPAKPSLAEKTAPVTGQKNIALVMKTLTNPFFVDMEKGARRAEKELGIHLIVKTGAQETSIDQQIAIIEELIRAKVDAIVIAPASSVDLIPVLKKAQDAQIAIVNIDNRLDAEVAKKVGLSGVPFVSVDNEKGAYLSAKFISDKITGPTEVLVIEGIRSAENSQARSAGALRAFRSNPYIHVTAVETANWKIDEAYEVAVRQFAKNPEIGAVFCANDMMALGVIKYLSENGKKNIPVAAFDALDDAIKAVKDGWMAVTVDQKPELQGYLGVKFALQKLRQEAVPADTIVEVKLIHRESM